MPPEIIAALFGLIGGAIASLIAPWVHFFIERRKKSIEYKIQLISNTRKLLNNSAAMTEIKSSSLWGFINDHLSDDERNRAFPVRTLHVKEDDGAEISEQETRKQSISKMLSRLEREWKLV